MRLLMVSLLFLLVLMACSNTSSQIEVGVEEVESETSIETDRAALMALFNGTGGENWKVNEGWGSTGRLSNWHGLTTIGDLMGNGGLCYRADSIGYSTIPVPPEKSRRHEYRERVVGLTLIDNGLAGEIPPELGNLSQLNFLNLRGNNLSGEIPSELGNLTGLVYELDLGFNQLTGQVPSELGKLHLLQLLFLNDNGLEGKIPSELGQMAYLERMHLENNQLTGKVPKELGELKNLYRLYLIGNELEGCLPHELRLQLGQFAERNAGLPFCK